MKKLAIIMYHRIVKRKIEFKKSPFNLTEKEFEEQIDYLAKNFSIIDYSEFKEIINEKKYSFKKTPLLLIRDLYKLPFFCLLLRFCLGKNNPALFFCL